MCSSDLAYLARIEAEGDRVDIGKNDFGAQRRGTSCRAHESKRCRDHFVTRLDAKDHHAGVEGCATGVDGDGMGSAFVSRECLLEN